MRLAKVDLRRNLLSGTSGSVFARSNLPLRRLSLDDLKGIVLTLWARCLPRRLASSIALGQPRRSPSRTRNRMVRDPGTACAGGESASLLSLLADVDAEDSRLANADGRLRSSRAPKSKPHFVAQDLALLTVCTLLDRMRETGDRTRYFRALSRAGGGKGGGHFANTGYSTNVHLGSRIR